MRKNLLSVAAAAALIVASTAVTPAAAVTSDAESTTITTGKPKKKTTKKKTSSKKSSSKKSTSSSKSSSSKSSKSTKKDNSSVDATTGATSVNSNSQQSTSGNTSTENASGNSTAGSLLGGILSSVVGGSGSSSSNGSASGLDGLVSSLTSIFDASKTATADKLVGTWKYTEPAVVFESDNVLKSLGGKVASATIEKKLQEQFEKVGIKKGAMTMTFDKDGNFTQTIGGKQLTGTYTVSKKEVKLTYTGGIKQLVGTTQLDGNQLLIVMDASKLLKYAGSIGKLTGNSTISTLSSLLGGYDGMEVGLALQR